MVRCSIAWCSVALCRAAWRGVAWRGVAWRGVAWHGVAWRGVAFKKSCGDLEGFHGCHLDTLKPPCGSHWDSRTGKSRVGWCIVPRRCSCAFLPDTHPRLQVVCGFE